MRNIFVKIKQCFILCYLFLYLSLSLGHGVLHTCHGFDGHGDVDFAIRHEEVDVEISALNAETLGCFACTLATGQILQRHQFVSHLQTLLLISCQPGTTVRTIQDLHYESRAPPQINSIVVI
jgi:hypothetical protein